MTTLQHLLLGVVQGLTEFLPISSSGHLVFFNNILSLLFPYENLNLLLVTLVVHLATLFSIVIFLRKELFTLGKQLLGEVMSFTKIGEKTTVIFMIKIVCALIPTGLVGFFGKEIFKQMIFLNTKVMGYCFVFMSVVLFLPLLKKNTQRTNEQTKKDRDWRNISFVNTLIIGLVQMFAILPGISRSGSTIVVALLLGVHPRSAFLFSFLLAIPTISGSFLFETKETITINSAEVLNFTLFATFSVAFIFGLISLTLLKQITQQNKLHYFSYYLMVMGIITLIFM